MPIPDQEERIRRAEACRQTIELERRRRQGKSGVPKQPDTSAPPAASVREPPGEQNPS